MERLPDESIGVHNVGPDNQRFGAWARVLPAGKQMRLQPDPAFIDSLEEAAIRITYLDQRDAAGTSFTVQCGQMTRTIDFAGSGGWVTRGIAVKPDDLDGISIVAGNLDLCLHMVEVVRK